MCGVLINIPTVQLLEFNKKLAHVVVLVEHVMVLVHQHTIVLVAMSGIKTVAVEYH